MANDHDGDGLPSSQLSSVSKECRVCFRGLPIIQFGVVYRTLDSRLDICKECVKEQKKRKILEFDRRRSFRPDRVEYRALYRQTEEYRRSQAACGPKWDANNKEKKRAHVKVRRAIIGGILTVMPCESCGSSIDIEAHHDDYSKPLDVRWLCTVCHGAHHRRFDPQTGKPLDAGQKEE